MSLGTVVPEEIAAGSAGPVFLFKVFLPFQTQHTFSCFVGFGTADGRSGNTSLAPPLLH